MRELEQAVKKIINLDRCCAACSFLEDFMGNLDELITDEYLDDDIDKASIEFEDEDEDDLVFEDEIDSEWEKRGCSFSEYKDFVSR